MSENITLNYLHSALDLKNKIMIKKITHSKQILAAITLALLSACSTVSNMPEWDYLYTGLKKTTVQDKKDTYAESEALSEVKALLAYAPNNSLFGSSSVRSPFPIGLWIHNNFEGKENPTKFDKWLNNSFGSDYITINNVNPQMRAQIATNTLQNYGYFNGNVTYEIVDQSNPRKKKIKYDIDLNEPYMLDTVSYEFKDIQDSIIQANFDKRHLKQGDQFSVVNLDAERARITEDMKDNGYFYFRDDYISYFADSVQKPQAVIMVVGPNPDAPENSNCQMNVGNINLYIRSKQMTTGMRRDSTMTDSARRVMMRKAMAYDDSLEFEGVNFVYQGDESPISTKVLRRNIKILPHSLYRKSTVDETTRNLSNMQIFKQIQYSFVPRDSLSDTLDVNISVTMDQLMDLEAEFSFTQKSNDQIGPHGKVGITKRNAFGHGETMSIDLIGSYEWQTNSNKRKDTNTPPDSYEAGLNFSLSYPWLFFPGLAKKRFHYPSSTTFKANIDHINRSGYYRLLSFGAEADYDFQTSEYIKHQFIPLTVKYNHLLATSQTFDEITSKNSALYMSLKDQFIPGMQYTFKFDNSSKPLTRSITHFEVTVKEAGNVLSGFYAIGKGKFTEEGKKIFGNPYAQFLKLQGELTNYFKLTKNSTLATRLRAGVVWTYGNSSIAPYSEMFFVGGANSIRAFTARSIGPGAYYDYEHRGTYLDQAGDFLLEANAEYRFRIISNLYGALFLDAGNVWLLNPDDSHDDGELGATSFLRSIALGTGFGFRYDLEFLVLRLDFGIGIHAPYDTGKTGYYNIRKFSDGLGIHFAVGYPF